MPAQLPRRNFWDHGGKPVMKEMARQESDESKTTLRVAGMKWFQDHLAYSESRYTSKMYRHESRRFPRYLEPTPWRASTSPALCKSLRSHRWNRVLPRFDQSGISSPGYTHQYNRGVCIVPDHVQ